VSEASIGSYARRTWSLTMLRVLARRLLPQRCVVCDLQDAAPEVLICAQCEQDFFASNITRCERCAIRVLATTAGAPLICGRCLSDPPHFDSTTTLADYASPVDGMVMALKFTARLDLAETFGRLLARRAAVSMCHDAIVVPVPLAFERMRQRGFNQSHQIARAFAAAASRHLASDRLLRVRHTPPQQSLALKERRHNVRGAFAVEGNVDGQSILVVDDVMTTGSTLDEIARVLKRAGAAHVHNLIAARTP
jgi:ComF family protein